MHATLKSIPADNLPEYVADDERAIAALIVSELVASGYALSVYPVGKARTVKLSKDAREVCAALATTDEDTIRADFNGARVGDIRLIWGNGNALLADWAATATRRGWLFSSVVESIGQEIEARFC